MARVSQLSGTAAAALLRTTLQKLLTRARLAPYRDGGGQVGRRGTEGLEKHLAAVFWEGELFSLSFTTHSADISSHKASNRIINDSFSFGQSLSPEQF